MNRPDTRRNRLAHVLWIGGGTDAGKTTVAEAIVARYGLQYYSFDRNERSHIDRLAATGYYQGRKNPYDKTPDELWVDPAPVDMARGLILGWAERAKIAVDDLLALPQRPQIVAEGPGFFPEVVRPLLSYPQQAIWFAPTPPFKRRIAQQRDKPSVRHQTRDPQRAQENIIARDLLVAQHVRTQATRLGLRLVEVDGTLSIEETVALVERWFGPHLFDAGHENG